MTKRLKWNAFMLACWVALALYDMLSGKMVIQLICGFMISDKLNVVLEEYRKKDNAGS